MQNGLDIRFRALATPHKAVPFSARIFSYEGTLDMWMGTVVRVVSTASNG